VREKFIFKMDSDRIILADLAQTIRMLRGLSVFINLFGIAQLVVAVIIPDILTPLLKIWLIVITLGAFIGITIGLILARNDPKSSLLFIILSVLITGLITGISIPVIVKK
jgi:hypothetical protein